MQAGVRIHASLRAMWIGCILLPYYSMYLGTLGLVLLRNWDAATR